MQTHTIKATGFMGKMGLWTKHSNTLPVTQKDRNLLKMVERFYTC